ncbi:MAG: DUF4369 domain-containing protein [Bacteroidaceae bacterium]|nr:DUF4369 domain-containing protein [Bacteroidaceae bacterium]
MKKAPYYIVILLALLSCSSHPGQVRLKGRFAHLEQGEFYLYSTDYALDRIDTLRIQDGRFQYQLPVAKNATLHLLYPNYSSLTLFASSGDDILIEGDAQNLSEVRVSGSSDNELYTQFRREIREKNDEEVHHIAKQYILTHPTLHVARHLFAQYFLQSDTLRNDVLEIFDSLGRAMPDDMELSRLSATVRSNGILASGQPLPSFQWPMRLTTGDGDKRETIDTLVRSSDYRDRYLLIVFWAGWKNGSQRAHYLSRKLRREMRDTLHILSYSLDYSGKHLQFSETRDSVTYPNYCDYLCWGSPYVQQWGIRQLPYYILVAPDQHIIASGSDWQKDIAPKTKSLCL